MLPYECVCVEGCDCAPGGGVCTPPRLPNQNASDDWFGGVGSQGGDLVFELLEPFGPLGCGDVFDLDAKKTSGGVGYDVSEVVVPSGSGAACVGPDGL